MKIQRYGEKWWSKNNSPGAGLQFLLLIYIFPSMAFYSYFTVLPRHLPV